MRRVVAATARVQGWGRCVQGWGRCVHAAPEAVRWEVRPPRHKGKAHSIAEVLNRAALRQEVDGRLISLDWNRISQLAKRSKRQRDWLSQHPHVLADFTKQTVDAMPTLGALSMATTARGIARVECESDGCSVDHRLWIGLEARARTAPRALPTRAFTDCLVIRHRRTRRELTLPQDRKFGSGTSGGVLCGRDGPHGVGVRDRRLRHAAPA